MQINEQNHEIRLDQLVDNDPLAQDAIKRLTKQQDLDGYFPPSCEKGGVME